MVMRPMNDDDDDVDEDVDDDGDVMAASAHAGTYPHENLDFHGGGHPPTKVQKIIQVIRKS